MSIHVALTHRTTYDFDRPVTLSPHVVRLRPAPHSRTPILSYSLKVEPEDHFCNLVQDPFGNYAFRLVFPKKTRRLNIVVDLVADLTTINPFDFFLEEEVEEFPFTYSDELRTELKPYLEIKERGKKLKELVEDLRPVEPMRTNDFLVSINQELERMIDYNIRMEPGVQSCKETLTKGSGSCRDSGYLLVQLLRHYGLASRFVSGYLVQLTPDEKPLEGPAGASEDFTDLHAWAEVFLPGAGWVGLDPTSGLFVGEGHIPLACTPDPGSAAPVTGALEKCEIEFSYENKVTRVHEDPRVTKPYSDEEWQAISSVGDLVDSRLDSQDVRLTMGGEPTFVSIDDMDGDEWNTGADSPFKRERGMDLLVRLQRAFAPGGLRWYGEGKWYPSEPVPRWAYGCFWRKDGVPLWENEELLADLDQPGTLNIDRAHDFAHAFANRLRIDETFIHPALEDVDYYRWKESTLPTDEIPSEAENSASLERRMLAKLIRRGVEVPSGYVLPIYYDEAYGGFCGGRWQFRRENLYLIPGSSPMGFRLPLNSLTESRPHDFVEQACPLEAREPLLVNPLTSIPEKPPTPEDFRQYYLRHQSSSKSKGKKQGKGSKSPVTDESSATAPHTGPGSWSHLHQQWMPRTALCFEIREGRLHIFFPPIDTLERYALLLKVVEETAIDFEIPVVIEGYEPPHDPRIERLKVTPDPGVIEVNMHPSSNWKELSERTEILYQEARLARLCAEKFMLDGRHTGTGGGNHVVVGAETPSQSPFLRRPGLLRSLITYWQHHPGLSYLFSGMFIGPTSQAPRVDEGVDDRLFELDIAFQQLPENSETPWVLDRVLRNLLTDLSGNTHRSEFSIDKLYSPDSSSGRLGLLELRAFEMPPHARMSLVQSLLVRSLISLFWDKPYRHKLVRWGTSLHDQFMLPQFVWDDVRDVVLELRESGIPFELEWLRAFHEFRFPVYGRVNYHGVEIELRFALEPWHVLGEEVTSQGTSRYVDSSVERLQVRARGLTEGRHVVLCNGRRVPLFPTGVQGEGVGGVRYKAWAPHSALHPTIGVQTPLRFDLVDTRNRKALGGCVYHVSHPGGLSYESFPVNAMEAESRRVNRFWDHGHTPGIVETRSAKSNVSGRFFEETPGGEILYVPAEEPIPEFPVTLDLRNSPESLSTGVRKLA
tara:strand:+ start:6626 stop:10111 length:3486 start_codon:yes stop_codon:yes gene_type:complete